MRLICVTLALLLMLPLLSGAKIVGVEMVGVALNEIAAETHSDILFWFNAEGTWTTTYAMGGSECNDGPTTSDTLVNALEETTVVRVGSSSLECEGGFGRTMEYSETGAEMLDVQSGAVAFWFYADVSTGIDLFFYETDAYDGDQFKVTLCNTDEVCVIWYAKWTTDNWASTTADLSTSTWYFMEIKYAASSDGVTGSMIVDISEYADESGTNIITDTSTGFAYLTAGTAQFLAIGDNQADQLTYYDNFMTSDDDEKDFFSIRLDTTAPSGACDG